VNNVLKHSEARNICIKASLVNTRFVMEITDDGKGFDVQKGYTGSGLKNIRHRVEELGGEIHMKSETGKGSILSYTIQLGITT
jgi:signal transduction histidine kinase